jgi:hypothetical protein
MISKSFALLAITAAGKVAAQSTPVDTFTLASHTYTYTALPYQVDTSDGERGPQQGYNLCNSTTQNQNSLCQTAIINSLDDFCLWGPATANSLIANTEGECVAWCTKPNYGTRLIPEGALTGVQFIQTPDYIQVTGNINQALIDLAADDSGGELDPHGADNRGNPIGSLVFSNAFPGSAGNPNTFIQAIEWHNFMGGGQFCLKACDPSRPNAANYCQHIFDRIGCAYNAPASYQDGVFDSCLGDSQDFPGIYTGANGVVSTYTQPDESLGPISTMPYTPKIPATSSCTTFSSAVLYAGAPTVTLPSNGTSTTPSVNTHHVGTSTGTGHVTASTSTSTSAAFVNSPALAGWAVGLVGAIAVLFL